MQRNHLRFVVEPRDVHLKAVRLFASMEVKSEFSAVVRLLNDNGDSLAIKVHGARVEEIQTARLPIVTKMAFT